MDKDKIKQKINLLLQLDILRLSYKHANIPHYDINSDLKELEMIYDLYKEKLKERKKSSSL